MYAAPPVIKTEIIARVPDSLRARENPRRQSDVARDCFLEGPSFDRDGNLYVTNIPYGHIFCHVGMGSVRLFSRLGRPLAEIQSCAGIGTTNAAYGGPERKTIYITDSETGTILSARRDVPGKEMYSHL